MLAQKPNNGLIGEYRLEIMEQALVMRWRLRLRGCNWLQMRKVLIYTPLIEGEIVPHVVPKQYFDIEAPGGFSLFR